MPVTSAVFISAFGVWLCFIIAVVASWSLQFCSGIQLRDGTAAENSLSGGQLRALTAVLLFYSMPWSV